MSEQQPGVTPEVPNPAAGQAAPESAATAAPIVEKPEGAEPDKPVERTFTQKELDAIVQREKGQERRRAERIARAEAETALLREQVERDRGGERAREERRGATEDREPDVKDYSDYAAYDRAIARWEARQVIRQEMEQREKTTQAERDKRDAREEFDRDRAILMKGAKEFRDFADVVFDEEAPVTRAMMRAALESEIPSKVAYYLAHPDHRDEAMQIAELSPTRQAAKVHEIAERLTKAPKPNALPDPIKPGGGESKVTTNPDDMPMDQWLKWRNTQPDVKRRARRP